MSSHDSPRLSPSFRRALERVSAFDVAWDARWHRLDAMTGQVGTGVFSTAASLVGNDGATLAALAGQPRWQSVEAVDPPPPPPPGDGAFSYTPWGAGYSPWTGGVYA